MSKENVELVRRLNECFARGEHEWPFTVYHPEIVWEPIQVTGIEPVYRGHEGVRRAWRDWFSAFAAVEFVATELGPYAQVWTIRDGRCTAMEIYADVDEGLRSAGVGSD